MKGVTSLSTPLMLNSTECDVLVVGSGAGGLAAAVVAAHLGLSVIVAEKAAVLGGTTAVSGGWLWIPNTPHAQRASKAEPIDEVKQYLHSVLGDDYQEPILDRFLRVAPEMIAFFEENTPVQFTVGNAVPDFFGELAGARDGWRSVTATPFDGRELGDSLHLLRRAIPETTVAGMGIASGLDMRHFFEAKSSLKSAWHVTKRLARHAKDLCTYGRSTQLVNGNALAARLIAAAQQVGVRLMPSAQVVSLDYDGQRVTGATVQTPKESLKIKAKQAVVLAAGGFPHDVTRQAQLFKHVSHHFSPHHSAAPRSNTGDGLRLGESVGGVVDTTLGSAGAWSPVSLIPRQEGRLGRFPHLVERGKPGIIAVRMDGRRFTSEANPYHRFINDLIAATPEGEPVRCWLVCDHRFIRRYGLGAVKPAPFPLHHWVKKGYLKQASSWEQLAKQCGVAVEQLEQTVANYNLHAKAGQDPEFHKGHNLYQRVAGDAKNKPHPSLAPLLQAPFYAVEVVPGSLGTFAGLITNEDAQVLDQHKEPIPGLYAVGNDMNSIMRGHYPSGGITLGPAMTFGYQAAQHIAEKVKEGI